MKVYKKDIKGNWIEVNLYESDLFFKKASNDKWVGLDIWERKTFHKKEGSRWADQVR